MSYPGDGQNMAIYGKRYLSPEEEAGLWKECIQKQAHIHKNHLSIKGNGGTIWPGVKQFTEQELKQPQSYYNEGKKREPLDNYQRMFHIENGYNCKLHRDDREHTGAVGLDIYSEECKRTVPVRSSSDYGRLVNKPLEEPTRKHVRIDKVLKGFSRTRGTGIPSSMD